MQFTESFIADIKGIKGIKNVETGDHQVVVNIDPNVINKHYTRASIQAAMRKVLRSHGVKWATGTGGGDRYAYNMTYGKVNVFLKREGYWDVYITTKDEIGQSYHKKITLDLFPAQEWKDGTYVGPAGSCAISDLGRYDNKHWYYVNLLWRKDKSDEKDLFFALDKEWVKEEITEKTLENGMYLFTRKIHN